jgi:hypothetical protein
VFSKTLYKWGKASTVLAKPGYKQRALVYAGRQTNGQPNYVCRDAKRQADGTYGRWRAAKSDGVVCWFWDGEKEVQSKASDGFEFLVRV